MAELGFDPLASAVDPPTDEIPVITRDTDELPVAEPETDTIRVLAPRAKRPRPW